MSRVLPVTLGLIVASGLAAVPRAAQTPPRPDALLATDPAQRAQDLLRFRAYQEHLATVLRPLPSASPLTEVLRSMMRLADTRSTSGVAPLENRAMLLTLGFYAYGASLGMLVPEAADWPRPPGRSLLLSRRDDLAKHFLVSAAVAAAGGGPFAIWVGLYKEMQDTKTGGSGFSFTDLAADRAGTEFGLAATASAASARRLQVHFRDAVTEGDLMPSIAGLPEGLTTAQLNQHYGGPNGAAYNALIAEIDKRVLALPLFAVK